MNTCSPADSHRFGSGARIGDYTVDAEVRSEQTGVVYLATHVLLPRRVLIKVTHGGTSWSRGAAMQMLREACLLEALDHKGIPRVFECGVLPDRRPWTAIVRIDGVSLATTLAIGPLSLVDLVCLLRDVADLLHHAHARGVVHRKLTADSILRTSGRQVAVCVRHWDEALTLDTEARVSIHTRDDVYALGIIAYRALTSFMPDRRFSTSQRCPAAPAELASLIDHMLASDPTARPSSEEVLTRARWIADTVEQLKIEKPRWTPPLGMSSDVIPVVEDQGFTVRISRTRSS